MDIKFEQCEVKGETVEIVAKITANLFDIQNKASNAGYSSADISSNILNKIADAVANEYLSSMKMDLIEAIDLEKITKAIQLKVVEGFSLNAQNRM